MDLGGSRGVYVRDPDGHSYELFTTFHELISNRNVVAAWA